jgi:hypothetical protein
VGPTVSIQLVMKGTIIASIGNRFLIISQPVTIMTELPQIVLVSSANIER